MLPSIILPQLLLWIALIPRKVNAARGHGTQYLFPTSLKAGFPHQLSLLKNQLQLQNPIEEHKNALLYSCINKTMSSYINNNLLI